MAVEISRIFIGLPEELVLRVKWVAPDYRINPLSFTEGGSDIVIEYHAGEVLGYDRVKYPNFYIDEIIGSLFRERNEISTEEIGTKISRIYIRQYDTEQEYKSTPFEEIWNSARLKISITTVKNPVVAAKEYMDSRWRTKQRAANKFKKGRYKRW